jgi:replicative DNA helicase
MDIRHIQEELYPRIFTNAEMLFPELLLRRTAKGYVASGGSGLDGAQGKGAGKINYLETSPAVLFDNRSGITRNVIKYIQEREHLPSYLDALRFCAKSVGYSLSEDAITRAGGEDSHAFELEQQKRQAFEDVQRLFVQFLWNGKENRALAYLRARGYTDDDIRAMNAGSALPFPQLQQHLRTNGYSDEVITALGLQSAVPDRTESGAWHRIGETYLVSFPIRDTVGRMQGFIIRADNVLHDEAGKERFPKYVFTKNLSKAVPIGFNHTLVNAHVIAVEGIVDALFLQARGFRTVIAVGGKHLTDEQLQTLERYRIRSLTLCFDNDAAGKRGTAETIEKIRRRNFTENISVSAHNTMHSSWNLYVCRPDALQTSKDPDEFVRTFGNEAFALVLQKEVDSAEHFMARFIAEEAGVKRDADYSPKQRDEALERSWAYSRYLQTPFQTYDFLQELSVQTGLDANVLNSAGNLALEYHRREAERGQLAKALSEAETALRKGGDAHLIRSALQVKLHRADSASLELTPYRIETFLDEIAHTPDGLRTGYPELDESLCLSQNGITIIAARPSHGKTSFKMNLLLNLLKLYPDRTFTFFSYEEPVKIITLKLLNMLSGVRFQGQQLQDLIEYLRHQHSANGVNTSSTNSAFSKMSGQASIEAVEEAKRTLGGYLESGRLVLAGERYAPEDIRRILTRLQDSVNVGGVFVDYVQKIKPTGKFSTRQLELQEVSAQLHGIAVDLHVPMIVGAQFNREVRTESDIRDDCLREAGDLEQDANLVLALWNPAKSDMDDNPKASAIANTASNLDPRRVELKVKTLKNRDGAVNLKGVTLLYDMPLSTIRSAR